MTERPLAIAELGKQEFETVIPSERFRLRFPGVLLTLEADRLRWERGGELVGLLTVRLDLNGVPEVQGIAEASTLNFSSLSARSQRATLLSKLTDTPHYPWQHILQVFCLRVFQSVDEGEPALELRDVSAEQAADTAETVLGLPILRYDPQMLVAKGGEGKSLLLLKILGDLAHRGYRVGMVDSEWNPFVHRDRLGQLFGDDLPSVSYLQIHRSLVTEVDRVRRFCYEHGLDFVGLDSVGMGAEGSLEYSEGANAYHRAVRSLGRLGKILISHTKHDAADNSHKRPYGSPYWMNGCRSVWFLKSAPLAPNKYELALENIKVNVKKAPTVALHVTFGDRITFEQIGTTDLVQLADSVPIRERIAQVLKRRGSMTLDDIAEELDEKRDTVKRILNRDMKKLVTKVVSTDGTVARFGLLERRAS